MTNTRLNGSYYNTQNTTKTKISTNGRNQKVWDCESLLYDSYELVSFAHIIERKLMPLSPPPPPLTRPSCLTLRALMDRDKDEEEEEEYSSAYKKKTCYFHHGRKYWWNRKKNDNKMNNKKKILSHRNSLWNLHYKNLFCLSNM
ncbi:unnamed protein product [Cochlearia groenlandica]